MKQEKKVYILMAVFIASLAAASFLGGKITAFPLPQFLAVFLEVIFSPVFLLINALASLFSNYGIIDNPYIAYNFFDIIHVSVGILAVPMMFLATDIAEEVLGKERARNMVTAGVLAMVFLLILTIISVWLPADPTRQYFSQEDYASIFNVSMRMFIASILAFILAQNHDIWAFNFWKEKTKGKYLWLRNNASTIVSQLIDSAIFMFVAFYALTPKFTVAYVIGLIIPYWIFKILFALLDTPFAYWGVKWLKKQN